MIPLRSALSMSVAAALLAAAAAPALAGDVSLDNLSFATSDGGTVTIKHVEFDSTNLTRAEVATLFSSTVTRTAVAPIIAKLQAAKILIPEMVVADGKASGSVTFHDFQATGVNAGTIEHMSLAGFDGRATEHDIGAIGLRSGPIAVDGGDFSRLLPALRDGDIASAGASKINHFSWHGFSMTFPDKDTPASAAGGNLYNIAIASIDGNATYSGDVPAKASGELKGLTVEPPKASGFGRALTAFGYAKIDIGLTVTGTYDAGTRTYVLEDYTIDGADAGKLGLKARFGGIDKAAFTGDQKAKLAALAQGNVSSAGLSYVDKGLFDKAVAFVAKMQKKTPSAVKAEWSAMTVQMLPALLGGDPASLKLANAVSEFIAAPKALTVTVKAKGPPVAFSEIMAGAPAALMQRIDIDATAQ